MLLPLLPLVAMAGGDLPVEVGGIVVEEGVPARVHVRQGDRRGVFVLEDSGDDLYLFWVETTPAPARSPLLPPCPVAAAAALLPASVCAEAPADGARRRAPFALRTRAGRITAELLGFGPGTEQWVWQLVPARVASTVSEGPPGWRWDAAAWGVGVPLFLPDPVGVPPPMIIGHRGSPGRLPDHTLEGYRLAVAQGADAIEPDLVATKDGVLVARHENELSLTTDVAARFPSRKRTAVVDGHPVEGWFVEDFTLDELRTLRAVQPWPDRPHDHDGLYAIPTFDEVLALAARLGEERGRPVVVVPELKHPSYFRSIGLALEPKLDDALARATIRDEHVVVQSFELRNLAEIRSGPRRLFLVGDPAATIPGDTRTYGEVLADLPALRREVECLGVPREAIWGPSGPTGFLERAQAAGLQVYVWTFRAERPGSAGGGDVVAEIAAFLRLGVDGVFADQPDLAARAREMPAAETPP